MRMLQQARMGVSTFGLVEYFSFGVHGLEHTGDPIIGY